MAAAARGLMGLIVREARPGDGEALARVHERGWTITHAAIADPSWITSRPFAERVAEWEGFACGKGAPMWVAEEDGLILGVIAAGQVRDDDAPPATGEVYALYVDPDRHREGIGSALLKRAVEEMRAAGYERASLWTFGESEQATAFYVKHGWRADGAEKRERNALHARYVREL
ncbi:MAG TPA: GNAT family N-acetyltransferase [Solirubrobacteraceae bacterium]